MTSLSTESWGTGEKQNHNLCGHWPLFSFSTVTQLKAEKKAKPKQNKKLVHKEFAKKLVK